MSSRKEVLGVSQGSSLLPLRLRRQLAAAKSTPSRVTAAPPAVEQDDSDDDDCCIIVPDSPKKKLELVEVPEEETASTSNATNESVRASIVRQSEEGQGTNSDGRTEKSKKTFLSSESLTARIRRNLQYLRDGREATPLPVTQLPASDDDDVGSMSVGELMKRAKGMVVLTNENKELKRKVLDLGARFNSLETRLHQKEGLVSQYESEIETMTDLLKDAENELDKAHKERMMKGHSSDEVNKLNKQLQSQKEAQEMQDQALNELQRQLKASQAENKTLKSSVSKATEAGHREEKDLTKKTQEIVKLKQALKDAETSLTKEKQEKKLANLAEQKVKSEMIYKCSLLTMKTEKLQKEEREVASYQEKLKRSEEVRRKALDVTNMCYSTIGAMAKELKRCKEISCSLSDLLQEIQLKLIDRQVKQITDGAGRTDITMDQNLKEMLRKIWEVQKQFRPVILIDVKDDNVGNIRSNVTEAPNMDTGTGTSGKGKGRGRGRGRGSMKGTPSVALPSAPAITNIPGDMTEFDEKTHQNNKLLLQCLDLLAVAHSDVSSKETQLAGLSVELQEVRKDLQKKEECYTIHVYEQSKEREGQIGDSDAEGGDDNTGSKAVQRVITSYAALPKPLDSTSPIKERRSSANVTVIPANDAAQEKMNVRMECESDGEMDEGSRTLGIQTEPIKDHVLVLIDSDDENPVVISDTEDEQNLSMDGESRSVGIGVNTSARYRPDSNPTDITKDEKSSSPVKALLTNVTTIPQSLFDNFSTPSDDVSTSQADEEKSTSKNDSSENIKSFDAEMRVDADLVAPREDVKEEDASDSKEKSLCKDDATDKIKALELIDELESQKVDLSRGPPTARYTINQIMMARMMLKTKRVGSSGVDGDAKGASEAEQGSEGGVEKTSGKESDLDRSAEGIDQDLEKDAASEKAHLTKDKADVQSVPSNEKCVSQNDEQSKEVSTSAENTGTAERDSDDQVAPSAGDEPSNEVENDIMSESLSVMKSLAEDAAKLFDFDDKGGKSDDTAEPPSGQCQKRKHSADDDDDVDDDDKSEKKQKRDASD
ncbi:uncharacterized protein LOC135499018 [Lineus longissimus]|uniref:uncharacterized protein LOC135499018 n=1 Tax=Lineus longissimus TaxID=88925 RepID=UPI002B4FAE84